MIRACRLISLCLCVIWVPVLTAESAAEFAEQLAPPSVYISCISCHGERGQGNPVIPVPPIAGQNEQYLRRQLLAFRDGNRGAHQDDIWGRQMALMATPLGDEDIAYLARFLNQQPRWPRADQPPSSTDADTLACIACHAPAAGSMDGTIPLISGMPEAYLYRQLRHYRDGVRGAPVDGAANPMSALIRPDMTDDTLKDLARFFAGS